MSDDGWGDGPGDTAVVPDHEASDDDWADGPGDTAVVADREASDGDDDWGQGVRDPYNVIRNVVSISFLSRIDVPSWPVQFLKTAKCLTHVGGHGWVWGKYGLLQTVDV